MGFSFNEKDRVIQEYLNANNIKYGFHYVGPVNSKEWPHDLFNVSFTAVGKEPMTSEYKTGIGHRIEAKSGEFGRATQSAIKAHRDALGVYGVSGNPTLFAVHRGAHPSLFVPAPTAARVLYSLILDADDGSETFDDFCTSCGYDTDSRKALEIYHECQKTLIKLRKVFSGAQLEKLRELLQDY